jgi:pimeloyl-ACP methyl ester carboxylesterase
LAAAVLPVSAAPPSTLVVYVGGVGSTLASAAANFAPLVHELNSGQRVVTREFVYGGSWATYTVERSCQPIAQSTAELVAFLRDLRAQQLAPSVVLVGHSNGGVLALEALAAAPDLAPFVRRVVTVDSPLGGVSEAGWELYGRFVGPCAAVDDLYARHETPGWADYITRLVQWEQSVGTDVRVVTNASDLAVTLDEQQVYGVDANYHFDASADGDWTNHGAVLHAPEVLPRLATIVAGA